MSSTPVAFSEDLLRGALLANGLSTEGSVLDMHNRLGEYLVRKLLAPETCVPDVAQKKKGKKRVATAAAGAPPKRTAWHAFLKTEKDKVKATGLFPGRVEVLKEVARRWALHKRVLCNEAPLMLTHASGSSDEVPSDTDSSVPDDGLIEALRAELDEAQLNAALAAHGLPVDGDSETKVKSLAQAMLA